jgi:quercetin dioxygenase-like cupin family protein
VTTGDGYTVASLDGLGTGHGFRKIRAALGVTAFGVNAIVLPAGAETPYHFHDTQQELYFVHSGAAEMTFGDGTVHRLDAGGLARVDPATPRRLRALGDADLIFVCVGGKDGYVPRDGRLAD